MPLSPNIHARPKAAPTVDGAAKDEPGVYVERHKNKACDVRVVRRNGRENVEKRGWDIDEIISEARDKAVEVGLPLFYRHVR